MNIREAIQKTMSPEEVRNGEKYLEGKTPVYLCLPFEGDLQTYVEQVNRYFWYAESVDCAVMAPYLSLIAFERAEIPPVLQFAQDVALQMIDACDEFWITRDVVTENVLVELARAIRKGMRVKYITQPKKEEEEDE